MSDGAAQQASNIRGIPQIPGQSASIVGGALSKSTNGVRAGGSADGAPSLRQARESDHAPQVGR
jgi:hypothetical protein